MRFCELKQKEVINCRDGERLGYVGDIIINVCTFEITHIIVPGPCTIWGIMGRDSEYIISCACIKKIGVDIILVDIVASKCIKKCEF